MKRVITFFIKNSLLVNLCLLAILIAGLVGVNSMNSSFFPATKEKFILIEAVYPGASPQEVEEGIVLKVEENLKGITGIDRVTSTSSENAARIQVEITTNAKADDVLQDVKNAVDQISNFPVDMERIVTYVQEVVNFTAKIAIVGDDLDLGTLKERAEMYEDGLRALPEVSKVQLQGFTDQEIEVAVKENRLRAYSLSFEEVALAIQRENVQTTGGTIKGDQEVIIRSNQKGYTARELGEVVVKMMPDGNVVRLKDVAELNEDWSENTNKAWFNGQRAILITVTTLNEENILTAAAQVREFTQTYNAQNTAVEAILFNDGTIVLQDRINLLIDNGWKGALIVFIVLALFLRIRLSFWVAMGIPISFLGMFVLATWAGITIKVLSLFGMILVIGILVDDGIVVGENVYQHYQRGASRFQAVVRGTLEVIPSIMSAILTTCLAFSIFFFVDGQMGDFFRDIAFVVIAALSFSLIEVLLFLPAHLAHIKDLETDVKQNRLKEFVENLLLRFRDVVFKPVLEFVLRFKMFSLFALLGVLVVTIGAIRSGLIQTTFFPENIEQNQTQVTVEFPAGTPEEVTEAAILQVKAAADALNAQYEEEYGKKLLTNQEIFLGPGSNQGQAIFYFLPSEERPLNSKSITSDLRGRVGIIPQATKLSFETATPFGKPLNVSFAGPDYNRLRQAVEYFQQEMAATNMVRDMITNDRADQPEINLELNETGRALGLTPQSVIRQVRFGFFGYEAQRLQRGNDEVKVWVRYALDNRDEVEELMNMRIRTPQGKQVPVSEVATLTRDKGLLAINHIDGKRQITVEGELAGPEVTSTQMIGFVNSTMVPKMTEAFPDVKITLEGQQRELGKVQSSLGFILPIVLGLIITVLIVTFRSVSQALALMMTIPFGVIGMAWGHYLHGQPISILSFLGFIALAGVIINDGLVFTNAFNNYLREGMKFDEALKETALSRFRPIVLTTVTTAAGLLPLLLEKSFQAQFLIPMAITIAYGLMAGSILLTLMLPVFLSGVNQIKVLAHWLWEGKKPQKREVEKAVIRQKNEEHYQDVEWV